MKSDQFWIGSNKDTRGIVYCLVSVVQFKIYSMACLIAPVTFNFSHLE